MNLTVAVIGGGNGAQTMAIDFASRGFSVRLWEDPKFFPNLGDFARTKRREVYGDLNCTGELEMVTTDLDAALDGAEFVCVVVPAFAYESIANTLKGKVKKDQPIIIYPGCFASLVFRKILGDDCPVLADVNNLPYGTRVMPDGRIHCIVVNPVNVSFFPAEATETMLERVRQLHPFVRTYEDVLENGLSVINPVMHTGTCLLNVAHVEQKFRGPYWAFAYFSPGAAKISVKLDRERDAIGRKFGYVKNRCLEEFYGKSEGFEWKWMDIYSTIRAFQGVDILPGPATLEHRYYTEDCGYGLVPWSYLAKAVGVETPVMDSVINIYSTLHERNWWNVGRGLDAMGLEGMSAEQIRQYLKTGVKA